MPGISCGSDEVDADGDGVPELFVSCWIKEDPLVVWKLTKDDDGKVKVVETMDPTPGRAALGAAAVLVYSGADEAVERAQEEGLSVSSIHLTFLSPLEPGLKEIFSRFKKVMTVELNYSDDPNAPNITPENRRRAQLATILRTSTLMDIECWSRVPGQPLHPFEICDAINAQLDSMKE